MVHRHLACCRPTGPGQHQLWQQEALPSQLDPSDDETLENSMGESLAVQRAVGSAYHRVESTL
jgi:hypothetical protein